MTLMTEVHFLLSCPPTPVSILDPIKQQQRSPLDSEEEVHGAPTSRLSTWGGDTMMPSENGAGPPCVWTTVAYHDIRVMSVGYVRRRRDFHSVRMEADAKFHHTFQ